MTHSLRSKIALLHRRRAVRLVKICSLALLFVVIFTFSNTSSHVNAAVGINKQINFQGKVVNSDGTNVTDGSYSFTFNIYTVSSGGSSVWTETKTLTVTSGVFQTNLGDTTALPGSIDFNSDSIYLGITFNSDPAGEMSPRIRFTATPYAFNSDKLGGLTSGSYVQLAQGVQTDSSVTNPSIFLNKTGSTAAILELQKTSTDVLLVDNNGTTTLQAQGSNPTLVVKQTTVASPSGDIFRVQGATSGNFIQVTSTAANAGTVTIQSLGSNDLTLDSGSGNIILGTNTTSIKKVGTALSLDLNNAATSTITLTNTGAGNANVSIPKGNLAIGTSGTPSQLLSIGGSTGNLTVDSSGNLITSGTVQYANGATNTATYVCKNSSNQLAACSTTSTGSAFTQGGNSFGATAVLGTTDGNGLQIVTNGTTNPRAYFDTAGNLYLGNPSNTGTAPTPTAFTIQGTGSSGATGAAVGGAITVSGGAGSSSGTGSSGGLLTLGGGNAGSGTAARAGGGVTIQGGNAGTSGANVATGGGVVIQGGSGVNGGNTGGVVIQANSGFLQIGASTGFSGTQTILFGSVSTGTTNISIGNSNAGTTAIAGKLSVTGQASSTALSNAEAIDVNLNLARTVTFTGGAATSFATQRALVVQAPTYAATTGTLTITDAATQAITGGVVDGTNVAITNSYGLLIQRGAVGTATNSYGLSVNAQTGATNNYAATFLGGSVGVGTATPGASLDISAGSGLTTGTGLNVSGTYTHTAAETGNLSNISFTDSSTLTSGNSVTDGLNIATTVNTSGAGTKSINSLNLTAPVLTGCATGSCNLDGLKINTITAGAASNITSNGLEISSTGISAGTLNGITIDGITAGAGTQTALNIGNGWTTALNAGNGLVTGAGGLTITGAAVNLNANSNNAVNINTGTSTGTTTIGGSNSPLVISSTHFAVSSAGALSGITTLNMSGAITAATTANTINGLIINSGALSGITTINASSLATLSAGTNALSLTGAPTNTATNSLLALGNAISGGNVATNGGTYIGINEPTGAAGAAADFVNFQNNNTSKFKISSAGLVTAPTINATTSYQANGTAGTTVSCTSGNYLNTMSVVEGIVTGGACAGIGLSDQRLKTNIVSLNSSVLDQIQSVNAVNFNYDCTNPYFQQSDTYCEPGLQTGVIAQQIAQIFPAVVSKDGYGYYHVDYQGLSAYTLKAVSEIAQYIHANGSANFGALSAQTIFTSGIGQKYTAGDADLTSGEVVYVDANGQVRRSTQANQPGLVGIITPEAGLVMGDSSTPGQVTVAAGGNVPVKVSPENGAIQPGDWLTSSSTPGVAMKSSGNGPVIGMATTAFAGSGQGQVMATASLGSGPTANSLASIQDIQQRLSQLQAQSAAQVVSGQTTTQPITGATFQPGQMTLNLDLIVNGAMTVQGQATFQAAVRFMKDATFEGNIIAKGQVVQNQDAGGYAVIAKGQTTVSVSFSKPYASAPLITLSLGNGKFANYSYQDVTVDGFDIILDKPAAEDLTFSWLASSIDNPKTALAPPPATTTTSNP